MIYGGYIKAARIAAHKTQKELAAAIGKTVSSVQKYEMGLAAPPVDVLRKIAEALGVSITALMTGSENKPEDALWHDRIARKLKQIGYSIGFYEEDAYLWINYPDGTLEVTEDDLKELQDSTNEYLRFKLDELKRKRLKDWRPT